VKRAVVVGDGRLHVEAALGALTSAGFEAVAVASTAEARSLVESGAVAVVVGVGGVAWDQERALPLATLAPAVRRASVVALVGEGMPTGDGLRAFVYGVDLVVSVADLTRLGELLGVAVTGKRALVAPLDPHAAARLGG
jgi:hypothetical protein